MLANRSDNFLSMLGLFWVSFCISVTCLLVVAVFVWRAFIIEPAPKDSNGWMALGMENQQSSYDRIQKAKDSLECFEKAASLRPDWPDPHREAGYCYIELGRYDAALEQAEIVRSLHDDSFRSITLMGISRLKLKQWKSAISALKQAHRMEPDDSDVVSYLVSAYENNGDISSALKIFDGFAAKYSYKYPRWIFRRRAELFFKQGRYRDSYNSLRIAMTYGELTDEDKELYKRVVNLLKVKERP